MLRLLLALLACWYLLLHGINTVRYGSRVLGQPKDSALDKTFVLPNVHKVENFIGNKPLSDLTLAAIGATSICFDFLLLTSVMINSVSYLQFSATFYAADGVLDFIIGYISMSESGRRCNLSRASLFQRHSEAPNGRFVEVLTPRKDLASRTQYLLNKVSSADKAFDYQIEDIKDQMKNNTLKILKQNSTLLETESQNDFGILPSYAAVTRLWRRIIRVNTVEIRSNSSDTKQESERIVCSMVVFGSSFSIEEIHMAWMAWRVCLKIVTLCAIILYADRLRKRRIRGIVNETVNYTLLNRP